MALSRAFERVCWIPLAFWVAAKIYVSSFDGWGAWAAAPILVAPLAISMILGIVGVGELLRLGPTSRKSIRSLVALLLPWVPIIHVLVDNLWRSL